MANIALRLGLVLEQNLEDPDTRAVLGQVDTARYDGAGRGGSICRWTASNLQRRESSPCTRGYGRTIRAGAKMAYFRPTWVNTDRY